MTTTFAVRIVQVHVAKRDMATGEWHFLALRRSPTETVFPDIWQVVTGSIEENEIPQETAFRELEEETGLCAEELWVLPFVAQYFDAASNIMNFVPCFGAVVSDGTTVQISHEHSNYAWLRITELRNRLVIPSHAEAGEIFHTHILIPLAQGMTPVFARCQTHGPILLATQTRPKE